MSHIEAIFQDGVFKPVGEVTLPQNQRVRLTVESISGAEVLAWLATTREVQQSIFAGRELLPDSTPDIAEDRRR